MSKPPHLTKKDVERIVSNIKIPKSSPQCRFPSDVLKNMKKNANPKRALKLMKLNKFFLQEKCPFIHFAGITDSFGDSVIAGFWTSKQKRYPIDKLPNNIGIGDALILRLLFKAEYLSHFISKIIICDIKQLKCFNLRILYDEFKFLTSSGRVENVELKDTFVTSKKGEIISYENLLGLLPSLMYLKL
uniref:Homing endonuclease LAGLIDADG domain-containing protein n=1 Tax=Panagrolaimus davidi TaxID=227884 RepID=A0A914QW89_9BILA